MGNIFKGSDIVEMGILIEKNGIDFYNTLIKQCKNPIAALGSPGMPGGEWRAEPIRGIIDE